MRLKGRWALPNRIYKAQLYLDWPAQLWPKKSNSGRPDLAQRPAPQLHPDLREPSSSPPPPSFSLQPSTSVHSRCPPPTSPSSSPPPVTHGLPPRSDSIRNSFYSIPAPCNLVSFRSNNRRPFLQLEAPSCWVTGSVARM
jgi:hypothetical protein